MDWAKLALYDFGDIRLQNARSINTLIYTGGKPRNYHEIVLT